MKEYDLSDYATYKVLYLLDERREGYAPKSRYYKAIFLVSHTLLCRGIDICLPWRWYMYGPVVELDFVDSSTYSMEKVPSNSNDEPEDRLFYGKEPQVEVPFEIERAVDNVIKEICGGRPRLPKLLDQAYLRAPHPFINVLRTYDDTVQSSLQQFTLRSEVLNKIENNRQDLSYKFPLELYRPMYDSVLGVLELIRNVRDKATFDIIKPAECSKQMRRALAHGFSKDFHGHLPTYRVEGIMTEYEQWIEKFDDFVFNKEREFYRATSHHGSDHYEREIENLLG